jgi:hypothetical protein
MAEIASWSRIYPNGIGPEYEATPDRLHRVIASMNLSRDSAVPFKVQLRMADGSVVVVSPKGSRKPRQAVAS